jgi:hypothetical protein
LSLALYCAGYYAKLTPLIARERVRSLMDKAADDALIRGYRRHHQLFPLTNANDRHVAAAAFTPASAAVGHVAILTRNIKDFDRAELSAVCLSASLRMTFSLT